MKTECEELIKTALLIKNSLKQDAFFPWITSLGYTNGFLTAEEAPNKKIVLSDI